MKNTKLIGLLVILLSTTTSVLAEEYDVGQKNKKFTANNLDIKVGDTVKFSNEDPFYHNIFSLSKEKSFDLGSFKKGKFRTITFDKSGKINVECAIHPEMQMTIVVSK